MFKNARRIKQFLGHVFLVCSLFIGTITVLTVSVFLFSHTKQTIISPLVLTNKKNTNSFLLETQNGCQKMHLPCKTYQPQSDGSVEITLENGSIVIFSPSKDINLQLTSLQQALSQLTIKGKQFTKLDFRFVNPVASF